MPLTRRPLLMLLSALLAGGCTPEPPDAAGQTARPALWRIADGDTTIYLFGTVHLLPPDLAWQDPRLARAVAESDTLVLEIADVTDAARQAQAFRAIARAPGTPPPIADRVPPALRPALDRRIAEGGAALRGIDAMKSWAAAVVIGAGQWRETGATRAAGADNVLADAFRDAGKPVEGLETGDAQFRLFDTLPEPAQRLLLAQALREGEAPGAAFAEMVAAWARGDVAHIAAVTDRDLGPALAGPLLERRNAAWADWIARRLARPGTILVAVGAAHLAGPRSVQAHLAARRLVAERI